jgi:hypothetical protein
MAGPLPGARSNQAQLALQDSAFQPRRISPSDPVVSPQLICARLTDNSEVVPGKSAKR